MARRPDFILPGDVLANDVCNQCPHNQLLPVRRPVTARQPIRMCFAAGWARTHGGDPRVGAIILRNQSPPDGCPLIRDGIMKLLEEDQAK